MKSNKAGLNPIIHGNNEFFTVNPGNRDMSIIIDSIDFHEVSLAKIENVDVNVSINIVSSSIYNRLSNFVWLKQISQVFIKIQECELKSPYTIEGDTVVIDKFFWLSVEMKMYS